MRFGWLVGAALIFLIVAAGDIALRMATVDGPSTPPILPALILGAIPAGFGWWWASKIYAAWTIDVDDERIRVDHGVINRQSAFVPRTRIQHVSTEQGPIQRVFDLTSLTLHTAGARTPNIDIPHLELATAELLRQELVGDSAPTSPIRG